MKYLQWRTNTDATTTPIHSLYSYAWTYGHWWCVCTYGLVRLIRSSKNDDDDKDIWSQLTAVFITNSCNIFVCFGYEFRFLLIMDFLIRVMWQASFFGRQHTELSSSMGPYAGCCLPTKQNTRLISITAHFGRGRSCAVSTRVHTGQPICYASPADWVRAQMELWK